MRNALSKRGREELAAAARNGPGKRAAGYSAAIHIRQREAVLRGGYLGPGEHTLADLPAWLTKEHSFFEPKHGETYTVYYDAYRCPNYGCIGRGNQKFIVQRIVAKTKNGHWFPYISDHVCPVCASNGELYKSDIDPAAYPMLPFSEGLSTFDDLLRLRSKKRRRSYSAAIHRAQRLAVIPLPDTAKDGTDDFLEICKHCAYYVVRFNRKSGGRFCANPRGVCSQVRAAILGQAAYSAAPVTFEQRYNEFVEGSRRGLENFERWVTDKSRGIFDPESYTMGAAIHPAQKEAVTPVTDPKRLLSLLRPGDLIMAHFDGPGMYGYDDKPCYTVVQYIEKDHKNNIVVYGAWDYAMHKAVEEATRPIKDMIVVGHSSKLREAVEGHPVKIYKAKLLRRDLPFTKGFVPPVSYSAAVHERQRGALHPEWFEDYRIIGSGDLVQYRDKARPDESFYVIALYHNDEGGMFVYGDLQDGIHTEKRALELFDRYNRFHTYDKNNAFEIEAGGWEFRIVRRGVRGTGKGTMTYSSAIHERQKAAAALEPLPPGEWFPMITMHGVLRSGDRIDYLDKSMPGLVHYAIVEKVEQGEAVWLYPCNERDVYSALVSPKELYSIDPNSLYLEFKLIRNLKTAYPPQPVTYSAAGAKNGSGKRVVYASIHFRQQDAMRSLPNRISMDRCKCGNDQCQNIDYEGSGRYCCYCTDPRDPSLWCELCTANAKYHNKVPRVASYSSVEDTEYTGLSPEFMLEELLELYEKDVLNPHTYRAYLTVYEYESWLETLSESALGDEYSSQIAWVESVPEAYSAAGGESSGKRITGYSAAVHKAQRDALMSGVVGPEGLRPGDLVELLDTTRKSYRFAVITGLDTDFVSLDSPMPRSGTVYMVAASTPDDIRRFFLTAHLHNLGSAVGGLFFFSDKGDGTKMKLIERGLRRDDLFLTPDGKNFTVGRSYSAAAGKNMYDAPGKRAEFFASVHKAQRDAAKLYIVSTHGLRPGDILRCETIERLVRPKDESHSSWAPVYYCYVVKVRTENIFSAYFGTTSEELMDYVDKGGDLIDVDFSILDFARIERVRLPKHSYSASLHPRQRDAIEKVERPFDAAAELSNFYGGEVPGYVRSATRDSLTIEDDNGKVHTITVEDFKKFMVRGRLASGMSELGTFVGESRYVEELAEMVMDWFEHTGVARRVERGA